MPEALLSALIGNGRIRPSLVPSLWSSTSGVAAWCQKCGVERELPGMTNRICPDAVFPHPKLTRGLELKIISVEVDDERANR